MSKAPFKWGKVDGKNVATQLDEAFEEQKKWRKNTFLPPSGHAGIAFVAEHARLASAYALKGPEEHIAMKAIMVMPALLLQKPDGKGGCKEFNTHLQRRMELWKAGEISKLRDEVRAIQERLPEGNTAQDRSEEKAARAFADKVFKGEIHAAMEIVQEKGKGGVLPLTPDVRASLAEKHPKAEDAAAEALLPGEMPHVDPIIFAGITGTVLRKAFLKTKGAAGPSQADAYQWRRMATSFGKASTDLCDAIAACARRMATEYLDPEGLMAFLCNRLIPLDKCPGIRPVGIGEVLRRVIGKAIMTVLKGDVINAAGVQQLCAGQKAGIEAAVHAIRQAFEAESSDGLLLVDADNAFNRLNRRVALHNVRIVCPPLATILTNWYRAPARLFVSGGWELSSEEGTTQGCPLAMVMYAIALMPLLDKLRPEALGIKFTQAWYADDAANAARLQALRIWWDKLCKLGPAYGYYPKASKTWLVIKPGMRGEAERVFAGTGVQLTEDGPGLAPQKRPAPSRSRRRHVSFHRQVRQGQGLQVVG